MLSVGAIRFEDRFCASRKGGTREGGCTALANSAWRLLQLAWSALDGPFFCFLVQTSVENGAFTLYGLHFWLFRQLSVWRSVLLSEGPDCWTLGNEWVWSGSWTCKELLKEAVDQVSWANSRQKWKYRWKNVAWTSLHKTIREINLVFKGLKPSPALEAPGHDHLLGLAYDRKTWACPMSTVLATVAFLLLLDTSLLSQAGTSHYSQLLTLQHSTKLLLFYFYFFY